MAARSLFAIALLLVSAACLGAEFVEPILTQRIAEAKVNADEQFESGHYADAYRLYREELAPVGDKYAQYMVGWMHLKGLGVEQNEPLAAAWLSLAAERGGAQLLSVRDEVLAGLDAGQREQVQTQLESLSERYGDCTVTRQLLEQEEEALVTVTGTRLPGTGESLPVTVINGSPVAMRGLDQRELRKTAGKRKEYIRYNCRD